MSEEPLSKRERQKQRRDAKRAEQQRAQSKARRNRFLMYGVVALVVIGLVGVGVYRWQANRAAQAAIIEEAEQRAAALGCTPDEEQPDQGAGHFESAQQITSSPPEVVYPDRPPTSGLHHPNVVQTGVYDVEVDPRILVHNLEHGYVVAYYDDDAPADQVEALKTAAEEQIDGDAPKTIVAKSIEPLPEDSNFAFTAWHFRQMCEEFDETILDAFTLAHHGTAGEAPERTNPAHLDQGFDPAGEPLLLPPLGEADPELGDGAPTEGTEGASGTEAPAATETPS